VSSQFYTTLPAALPPVKKLPAPTLDSICGPQRNLDAVENRKLSCPFLGSKHDCFNLTCSLIAISTEQSRLLGFVSVSIKFRQTTGTKALLTVSELGHSGKRADGYLVRYLSFNARRVYSSKAKNEHEWWECKLAALSLTLPALHTSPPSTPIRNRECKECGGEGQCK
jgi:hypothetical protein